MSAEKDCEPMQTEKGRPMKNRERIEALEQRVAELERRVSYQQMWVTPIATSAPTTTPTDCGCPTDNYICNNYVCPRGVRLTS